MVLLSADDVYNSSMSMWTDRRRDLATRIAWGLAGWLQFRAAQRLQDIPGEDSFRLACAEVIHAQGRYRLLTSQRPEPWPETARQRVDMALLPISENADGWYGAVELKWPSASGNFQGSRLAIIQDAVRLATVQTGNLNARLLVLGGTHRVVDALFDRAHANAQAREAERVFFREFLSRDLNAPQVTRTDAQLRGAFGLAYEGLPDGVEDPTGVTARLLATATAALGTDPAGHVYVWQCDRRKGRRPGG